MQDSSMNLVNASTQLEQEECSGMIPCMDVVTDMPIDNGCGLAQNLSSIDSSIVIRQRFIHVKRVARSLHARQQILQADFSKQTLI